MSPPLLSGPDTLEWPLPTASFIPEGIRTRDVTVAPFSDGAQYYEIFMYGLFLTLLFRLFKKSTDLRCSN